MKLTNTIREQISSRLIKHKFGALAEQLKQDTAALAEKVYNFLYTEELEKINSLEDGWLPVKDDVKVAVGSEVHRLDFNGTTFIHGALYSLAKRPNGEYRRFLCRDRSNPQRLKATDPLAKRIHQLERRRDKLVEEIEQAKSVAWQVLQSSSTANALVKKWPEIKPFLPEAPTAALPTLPTQHLNKMFELPVKEEAA